ncbi:MAG: N-acetylornithine carbamoyltransferase [Planctomycetes bacterium]|nr:N-acetylornithine carbamoyltransferase [Planctomycetota bacterium]
MSTLDLSDRNLLSTLDLSVDEVREVVELALEIKHGAHRPDFRGRVAALLFFNPSVRTRLSSEAAISRFGGSAVAFHAGKDTWNFECRDGVVMDGATQEHVRELAPVISRMSDVVGIRKSELITVGNADAGVTSDYRELKRDEFLHAFAEHAEVPVINLESNTWHPMQGLADAMTMVEALGDPRGRKYVLTWAWHPKSLPVATPHSQLLAAADLGMDVTILRPDGWSLDQEVVAAARSRAEALGGGVRESDDVEAAYRGAHVVCAKAWGSLDYYGRFAEEAHAKRVLREGWIVDAAKMARTDGARFLHCLPVRRNVVVADAVLDGPWSAVKDEAENRLWTAAAIYVAMLGGGR